MTYADFVRKLQSFAENYRNQAQAWSDLSTETHRLGKRVGSQSLRWHHDGVYRDVSLSTANVVCHSIDRIEGRV